MTSLPALRGACRAKGWALAVLVVGLLPSCRGPARSPQTGTAPPAAGSPLALVQTVALPDVRGRIDHLAVDVAHERLYIAALANGSLECVDLKTGAVAGRVKDMREPSGVAFLPEAGRVVVACAGDGSVRFYDGQSLALVSRIDVGDDADNVRYDAAAKRVYVGYGQGGLAIIDAQRAEQVGKVWLDAHPESFQLERGSPRVFVNVPVARHVAAVDREAGTVIAKWKLAEVHANYPMALDEANHRLLVGCRSPARLLVLDTEIGQTVATLECGGDCDDVFYDAAMRRVYASCGSGVISVLAQRGPDQYERMADIPTVGGARTSLFVPEWHRLYLAVPAGIGRTAELRVYEARP